MKTYSVSIVGIYSVRSTAFSLRPARRQQTPNPEFPKRQARFVNDASSGKCNSVHVLSNTSLGQVHLPGACPSSNSESWPDLVSSLRPSQTCPAQRSADSRSYAARDVVSAACPPMSAPTRTAGRAARSARGSCRSRCRGCPGFRAPSCWLAAQEAAPAPAPVRTRTDRLADRSNMPSPSGVVRCCPQRLGAAASAAASGCSTPPYAPPPSPPASGRHRAGTACSASRRPTRC